ncbi:unnamed protein product [marine sediment metagenome]|uniref:Uncharacterized protein n=1 Tax=marine sediment metagenome TaxID=412755 RepID=X0RZB5_9ZZZZ
MIEELGQEGREIFDESAGVRCELSEKSPAAEEDRKIRDHSAAVVNKAKFYFEPEVQVEENKKDKGSHLRDELFDATF